MNSLHRPPYYVRGKLPIVVALALLGYLSPWLPGVHGTGTLMWLAIPGFLIHSMGMSVDKATVMVTIAAGLLLALGACIRVWDDVWPSSGPAHPLADDSGESGRGRFWSYAGGYLFAVGTTILMPPSGTIVFLVGLLLYMGLLVVAERRVRAPGDLRVSDRAAPLRWIDACVRESFFFGFAGCFAVLARRYNAQLLVRSLLICFGASLVLRAGMQSRPPSA